MSEEDSFLLGGHLTPASGAFTWQELFLGVGMDSCNSYLAQSFKYEVLVDVVLKHCYFAIAE